MEAFLRVAGGRERKRLLIGPACCRGIWSLLPDARLWRAVEWADRPGGGADVRHLCKEALRAESRLRHPSRRASRGVA